MDTRYWNYNKDPHKQIFAIFRLNLQTGTIESVAGGNGGAARPSLSHDGQTLAFIQRRAFNSSLVIKNLSTGNEMVLVGGGGLSFDQQESWAPCGVYPFFSWNQNDTAILIWGSQGKFFSVNVQAGVSQVINMEVNVNLSLAPTVRTKVGLSGSAQSFNITAINWISRFINPGTGNSLLAYTALGSTYGMIHFLESQHSLTYLSLLYSQATPWWRVNQAHYTEFQLRVWAFIQHRWNSACSCAVE